MTVSKLLSAIHASAQKHGVHAYAVGGFVRDYILNNYVLPSAKDVDFVVLGSGVAFARLAVEDIGGTDFVAFEDFDTARFKVDDMIVEIAGARSEEYSTDSRKPEVAPAHTLEEDVKRRDFTINALAAELNEQGIGKLIDSLGGLNDLEKGIIKTPLDPDTTFSDDPLRIVRACRFAGRFNFEIEAETRAAITRNILRLEVVSWERIKEELDKILLHDMPSRALWHLFHTGVLEYITPELTALTGVETVGDKSHKDQFAHTLTVVDQIVPSTDKLNLRWAALLHDIGKAPTKRFDQKIGWTFHAHDFVGEKMFVKMGKRLRFDNDSINYIKKLIRWHLRPMALCDEGITDSAVRRLIVNMEDDLEDLLKLYRADITTKNPKKRRAREADFNRLTERINEVLEKDELRAFQSPVRGEEIMELCGLPPGKQVGVIKKAIEEAILDGVIPNTYEAAKQFLQDRKDELVA